MSDILKILLVEDNPGDIVLLRETLREMTASAYELKNVSSLSKSIEEIRAHDYDVVLLDLNLPDGKGLDNIKRISRVSSSLPIVVLTGLDDEMMAVEAVRQGAQDYLVKGEIAPDVFWRAMRYAVERKRNDEKIQSAKILAESATQAKSEFLAHMSHEIRTPLNVILGISDLLMDSPLNEEQKHYVEIFKNSSETLLYLINDLLDLSKIEAGKLEINNVSFDLIQLVRSIEKFMGTQAQRKNNSFKLEIADNCPSKIISDPQRLRQLLYNLLGNAIKFTENGSILCKLSLAEEGLLQFTIADTGIGISSDKIEKIFESFTQEDSSTSQNFGGTGLGLSICSKLVGLWKGKIWAESRKGKGSQFHFTLPFKPSPSIPHKTENNVTSNGLLSIEDFESNYSQESPLKILVADDSVDNRFLLNAYLKSKCIYISNAQNGQEALELTERDAYDIILLDMQMPVMSGYEFASEFRKRESEKRSMKTPIIALTALSQVEDKGKCIDAGCSDYLSKPIEKGKLFLLMAKWLKLQSSMKSTLSGNNEASKKTAVKIDIQLKELIPEYLERKKKEVASLFTSLQNGDCDTIARIGHNMLGTGVPYGFQEISRLGGAIEIYAREKKLKAIGEKARELEMYLNSLELIFQ